MQHSRSQLKGQRWELRPPRRTLLASSQPLQRASLSLLRASLGVPISPRRLVGATPEVEGEGVLLRPAPRRAVGSLEPAV